LPPKSRPTRRTSDTSSRWVRAARRELRAVDLDALAIVVADAGYWHQRQIEAVVRDGIRKLHNHRLGAATA
jgi:hypothetical protein